MQTANNFTLPATNGQKPQQKQLNTDPRVVSLLLSQIRLAVAAGNAADQIGQVIEELRALKDFLLEVQRGLQRK